MKRPREYPAKLTIEIAPDKHLGRWRMALRINGRHHDWFTTRAEAMACASVIADRYPFTDTALYVLLKEENSHFHSRDYYPHSDGVTYQSRSDKHDWVYKDEIDFIEQYEAEHGIKA